MNISNLNMNISNHSFEMEGNSRVPGAGDERRLQWQ